MKKLYIFGPPMSGKNILWKLLDGHPKLFVNHVHYSIGTHFLKDNVVNYYKNKKSNPIMQDKKKLITIDLKINEQTSINLTIGEFFESLYRFTSYKDLYTLSKNNILITHNKELDNEYNNWSFEIEKFEKYISDEIFDCNKSITVDQLISKLQELFCKANNVDFNEITYFVDCLPNEISILNKLKNDVKNIDIIFLKRNAVDHCYANMRRNFLSRNNKKSLLKKIFLNENNIEFYYILNQYNFYHKHIYSYLNKLKNFNLEEKYIIIEFENLIMRTKDSMKKIINHLKIDENANLLKLSSNGQLINEKKNSLNNINDKAENIFSKKEINEIENFYSTNIKYKKIFNLKFLVKVFLKKYS